MAHICSYPAGTAAVDQRIRMDVRIIVLDVDIRMLLGENASEGIHAGFRDRVGASWAAET